MARLIESQLKDATNMAHWIDASPHEWPSADKIPHLCYAILDLNDVAAALTAERDQLRADLYTANERIKELDAMLKKRFQNRENSRAWRARRKGGE